MQHVASISADDVAKPNKAVFSEKSQAILEIRGNELGVMIDLEIIDPGGRRGRR